MKANIGTKGNSKFNYPLNSLVKHMFAMGGSGSGKTVLSKVVIEEAALAGIPSILVDPQGDLASLAKSDDEKFKDVSVKIYTPTSKKGIPICINPLRLPGKDIDEEDLISILNQIANSVVTLMGFKLDHDKGKHAQAIIYYTLLNSHKNSIELTDFNDLIRILESPSEELVTECKGFLDDKHSKEILKKLRYLTVGEKDLLFNLGETLDISKLMKNDISIIYLNTLGSKKDKEFFVSMLALQLYEWMLKNPSKTLQALFFIDEIADYIPAGSMKPITKDILKLIYKQARKYGVGCIVSTQNPGDIDYKAFAQFGTWAIGRLTAKQDREKIKDSLKSLTGDISFLEKLPKLKPGEFLIFSPDNFDEVQEIKVRWLYTKHETLTEKDVAELMKNEEKFIDKKIVKKESSVVAEKSKFKHWPMNFSGIELDKVIEKNKKKKFIVFGDKEKMISSKILLRPIFVTKIRRTKKTLLGKQVFEDYDVCFDAVDGNFVLFGIKSYKVIRGLNKLMMLTNREIGLMKTIKKKEQTNSELSSKLGLTESFVNKTMNMLMGNNMVSYAGKEGKAYIWKNITDIEFGDKIAKLSSRLDLSNKGLDGEMQKAKVNIKYLENFVRHWFNCEIIAHDIAYYPIYDIRLSYKNKARDVLISAVSGKVVN